MTRSGIIALVAIALAALVQSCTQMDSILLNKRVVQEGDTANKTNVLMAVRSLTNAIPEIHHVPQTSPVFSETGTLISWETSLVPVTNWTYAVVTTTNLVTFVTPANPTYRIDVDLRDEIKTGLDIAKFAPWPIVGQVASVLGLALQGYVVNRRKKLNEALTIGIEQHRNRLRKAGNTDADSQLLSDLQSAQITLNVTPDVQKLLVSQGFSTKAKHGRV